MLQSKLATDDLGQLFQASEGELDAAEGLVEADLGAKRSQEDEDRRNLKFSFPFNSLIEKKSNGFLSLRRLKFVFVILLKIQLKFF